MFLKQKVKTYWLKGDQNTKLFHVTIKNRRKVNYFNELEKILEET